MTDNIAAEHAGSGRVRGVKEVRRGEGWLSRPAVYPNLLTLGGGRDRVRDLRESQKTGDIGGGEELKDKLWD